MYVKLMQTALIGRGFNCGWYGADGEYGQQTKIALYQFQQKNGLETDNICGQETWKSLLNIG
jgi:peptidoglycan hydrolase-like protein with peptidoglycan-binding domain